MVSRFGKSSSKVLEFVDNGALYNFDLSQPIIGDVTLSSDSEGGTQISYSADPVTGYSTSPASPSPPPALAPSNPYSAVVQISFTAGTSVFSGTGFIVGPHTILTAAHVLTVPDATSPLGPLSGPSVTITALMFLLVRSVPL